MYYFHSPSRPKPLGLDLAWLKGGGACPAQFEGETQDGRGVYVRYRGGELSVDVAETCDQDFMDWPQVLQADIGPHLDGVLSLYQACCYAGLTVNGTLPDGAKSQSDLLGKITYFELQQRSMTAETSRKILSACHCLAPDALLVECRYNAAFEFEELAQIRGDTVSSSTATLILGATEIGDLNLGGDGSVEPTPGQTQIRFSQFQWRRSGPTFSGCGIPDIAKEIGRPMVIAGYRDQDPNALGLVKPGFVEDPMDVIGYDTLSVSARFETQAEGVRSLLDQMGTAIVTYCPEVPLRRVELETDKTLSQVVERVDPAIVEWCKQDPDRWIRFEIDRASGARVGVRPI